MGLHITRPKLTDKGGGTIETNTDSQKREEDNQKNEECDDDSSSSLLLQHKTTLHPRLSHSSPPPSLLLRRSFISESTDSLHGQRFPTLSTVNRRRWFRLRPSSFSGFLCFIRHRFPLPVLSPQGNATSAFE